MNKKAFTLLELLVVVLIIGILAAIALPQYKFAVAKSKYNTIKEMTESIANSVQRYYLATGNKPENLAVLDIDIPGTYNSDAKTQKILPNGRLCGFNASTNDYREIICWTNVFGKDIAYLVEVYYNKPKKRNFCYAQSPDTTDLVNKVCQKDTGKNTPHYGTPCNAGFCQYLY